MRITNRYMANGLLYSIQNNLSNLARSQEQLATSRRILRPSDDPNIMGQFLSIKATLSYNEQYNRNIDDGLSFLNMNDAAMGTMGDLLTKVKELTIQAANDTYNSEDRKAVAAQFDKMIDQVVDLANSTVSGKYIYAGTLNDIPPFKRDGDTIIYLGNEDKITREVLAGTDYRIDAPGVRAANGSNTQNGVFGTFAVDNGKQVVYPPGNPMSSSEEGIFGILFKLRDLLRDDSVPNFKFDLQEGIGNLQLQTDLLIQHRVAIGARTNHFETLKLQLLDQELKLTENLNNIEGVDMARLSIEVNQQLLAYQASLASGANLMKTSLLDYIR